MDVDPKVGSPEDRKGPDCGTEGEFVGSRELENLAGGKTSSGARAAEPNGTDLLMNRFASPRSRPTESSVLSFKPRQAERRARVQSLEVAGEAQAERRDLFPPRRKAHVASPVGRTALSVGRPRGKRPERAPSPSKAPCSSILFCVVWKRPTPASLREFFQVRSYQHFVHSPNIGLLDCGPSRQRAG